MSIALAHTALPSNKPDLRRIVSAHVVSYILQGNRITQCRPGIARGAEFSRNQHPRLGVKTA